ncbi:hypothetical protein TNIN_350321 [Trichonephila inaurata madagascariensis]|uniref:Uncharacterized protein n=1 Tax=Trichonephila inaurata madagascariensis TaxID=2747483 RepID=A0A8X6YPU6_9ARAC|nr:hypothetical protein TNIN_350321 [Trichonephila inaurata madagascariensis]
MRVGLDRALYWTNGGSGPRSRPSERAGVDPSDFGGMGVCRSGPRRRSGRAGRTEERSGVRPRDREDWNESGGPTGWT